MFNLPTKSNLRLSPVHMAQLCPRLVRTVNAGFVKCFDALDWTTSGVAVETCPRDRNGANSASRRAGRVDVAPGCATVDVVVRARLLGGRVLIGRCRERDGLSDFFSTLNLVFIIHYIVFVTPDCISEFTKPLAMFPLRTRRVFACHTGASGLNRRAPNRWRVERRRRKRRRKKENFGITSHHHSRHLLLSNRC